ncbi:MAG: tail fiber domain-containing protein [Bacteroidia bacterium]
MKKLLLFLALSVYITDTNAQTMNNVGTGYFGTPAPLNGTNSQLQTAQDNQLLIQGSNVFGSNAARNNIKVGIGVFPGPINSIADRLHLHDITFTPRVGTRTTNLLTGQSATDGFFSGINNLGHATLIQYEALPMRFFTTNTERMRIQANGFVGVNTAAPGNRFELNSAIINTSGFRFTQLTSASPTSVNPGPGVLAVNASGDIIYVPGGGSVTGGNNGVSLSGGNIQLGGACGSGLGALLSTREIPMAGFNINHTMPATSPSQFNIGFAACTVNPSRFSVFNDTYPAASLFASSFASPTGIRSGVFRTQNTGTGNAVGLAAAAFASSTAADAIGINAASVGGSGFTSFDNLGVNAPTANATHASIGLNADINASTSPINQGHNTEITGGLNATAQNTGASLTVSTPGNSNFGVTAFVSGAANNYGIFAAVPTSSGLTGAGAPPGPDYAGFFNGDVFISNMYGISDKRLKKDIVKIENSLDIIKKLSPVSYNFDQESHMNLNLAKGKQYGFISQEVQQILPELTAPVVYPSLVGTDGKQISTKEEYLGLNYQGFTAIMVDAIKQQQILIENQQKQIDELKELLKSQANLNAGGSASGINRLSTELSDKDAVVLNQNTPNPFAQQTVISYNLPASTGTAQLHFFDANGNLIKVVDLKEKGHGQLTVFAGDLSSGMYTYTLVIDGKTNGTKKMIKSE